MVRSSGPLPAAVYVAALQRGLTPPAAYALAYPTPALFSPGIHNPTPTDKD